MNIFGLIPNTYNNLILFVLVFTRISFLFSTFILFGKNYINRRVIIGLSSLLSLYALLISGNDVPQYELFSITMMSSLLVQALIGFMAGLILNILIDIFTGVGQIISAQIGLSMASLIDPRFGAITSLALFYNYLSLIIFLMLNGHLLIIRLILESFTSIPVDTIILPVDRIKEIILFTKNIFIYSVSLSMAIIISMLLTNLTVGVMTRFAPQFNIFSIGINITMILGLIFVYLMFNLFVSSGVNIFQDGFLFIQHIFSGLK